MATAKKTTRQAAGPADRALQVVSKRDGFRRAGREWSGTTTIALDEITAEERELLEAEPMLVVTEIDAPAKG